MLDGTTDPRAPYTETEVLSRIQRALDALGLTPPYDPASLPVDQYHAGGHAAVSRLVDILGVQESDRVLDVGSGLGGPARMIAAATGAHVDGVDITPEYVAAARWLTEQTGLEDRVTFTLSEIGEYPHEQLYDAAITMHVQMNVEGKTAWYASIAEHLRSGAKLGLWEICTVESAPLTWPMPWSITGTDSHLASPDELRRAIERAGFTVDAWDTDDEWLRQWFSAQLAAGGPNAGLSILDDGPVRAANFAGAFMSGQLSVVRAVATRP